MRRRAFCYITRATVHGPQLLVFRHADHDAGIQTPGGTIDPGESPIDGAIREAREETGLETFAEVTVIAVDHFAHPTDPVERYHVHLVAAAATPDRWTHHVSAGAADIGLAFDLYWAPFALAQRTVIPHMITHLADIAARLTELRR